MADFRKMVTWQKADDLVIHIYQLSRDFPEHERYGLTSQLQRAAVSVPANIAEGSGRQTMKDFRQFLYVARGSLNEVEYYLHLAERLGYITQMEQARLDELRQEAGRTLQGMINWASKEIQAGRKEL
jgi:four helix bundle protein